MTNCGVGERDTPRALGQLARLRDGGPVMLVRSITRQEACCSWYSDAGQSVGTFELSRLVCVDSHQRTWSSAALFGKGPPRVLIADDNVDAADTLGMALEMMGYRVQVAHSGREAMAHADRYTFDVAVLDLSMPDPDGYAVARYIRRTCPTTSLVALSGFSDAPARDRTRQAGFDRHLAKPSTLDELLAAFPQHAQTVA